MTRYLCVVVLVLVCGRVTSAQDTAPSFRPGHLTVSGGLLSSGGYPVGDIAANLRRNAPDTQPPVTLFRAQSDFGRATGAEARMNVALTRRLAVEVGGTYTTPRLGVTITGDTEAQDVATVAEQVSQYSVDVSGVLQVPGLSLGSRMRPYVIGGGGYLRQLHEDRLLLETGRTIHAGAGLQYWLRGADATARSFGARAEARYVRRTGGIDFQNLSRSYPSVSVLAFLGF